MKIRENCGKEQNNILEFFEKLTPENYNELKKAKKNYSDCIKLTKSELSKELKEKKEN